MTLLNIYSIQGRIKRWVNELGRMWKEAVVTLSTHYSSNRLEELRTIHPMFQQRMGTNTPWMQLNCVPIYQPVRWETCTEFWVLQENQISSAMRIYISLLYKHQHPEINKRRCVRFKSSMWYSIRNSSNVPQAFGLAVMNTLRYHIVVNKSNKMQQLRFYSSQRLTLHVSGDNLTHHQEYISCIWPPVSRLT